MTEARQRSIWRRASPLAALAALVAAVGIAMTTAGVQLYIADPAAQTTADRVQIFSLGIAAGSSPVGIGGTDGYVPRGLDVVKESGADQLYFTGSDKATGVPGV